MANDIWKFNFNNYARIDIITSYCTTISGPWTFSLSLTENVWLLDWQMDSFSCVETDVIVLVGGFEVSSVSGQCGLSLNFVN